MKKHTDQNNPLNSSPCFANQLLPGEDGYYQVDAETLHDVTRWRIAERIRLIDLRVNIEPEKKRAAADDIAHSLDQTVEITPDVAVSVYWPYQGEPNLREWMKSVSARGGQILLPHAPKRDHPLEFRPWTPKTEMVRGVFGIPYPKHPDTVCPDVIIAPLVGCDDAKFRLGYGGGFFDRTLASLRSRPTVIGVGHQTAKISTIFPLPHDIPMDEILIA